MSARNAGFAAAVLAGCIVAAYLALRGGSPSSAGIDERARSTGGRRPATGDRQPATGDRQPATGDRQPATGDRQPATAARPAAPPRPIRFHGPEAADKGHALAGAGDDQEPPWKQFDGERRDAAWAGAEEAKIESRIGPLIRAAKGESHGSLEVARVECRTQTCRLLVQSSDPVAFQTFLESLQDDRGFYGDAATLALDGYSAPADKATGNDVYQVRVHLIFAR